jgi:putative phage-type endonuclease
MSLTREQLLERRTFIGGSDAPALAGVNPPAWSQPIDVYLSKVATGEPYVTTSKVMALGSLLEDTVADLAADATGIRWRRHGRVARHPDYPWSAGNLDRIGTTSADEPALLECKWSMRSDQWGPGWQSMTDQPERTVVPLHYAVQVQHYLAVSGRAVAYLAVLLGYADFRWYRIPRNDEMIAWLLELEAAFWHDHVEPRVPPDPDGSAAYDDYIKSRHPADDLSERVATPEQDMLAGALRFVRREQHRLKEQEATVVQKLQLSMGDTARLVGADFTISWRAGKERQVVDWKAYASAHPEADLSAFTSTKPGTRPFLARFQDEDYFEGDR